MFPSISLLFVGVGAKVDGGHGQIWPPGSATALYTHLRIVESVTAAAETVLYGEGWPYEMVKKKPLQNNSNI